MILEDVEYLWQCMSEGFRLLNSEIGNDHKQILKLIVYMEEVFVSLTRR